MTYRNICCRFAAFYYLDSLNIALFLQTRAYFSANVVKAIVSFKELACIALYTRGSNTRPRGPV